MVQIILTKSFFNLKKNQLSSLKSNFNDIMNRYKIAIFNCTYFNCTYHQRNKLMWPITIKTKTTSETIKIFTIQRSEDFVCNI